MCKSKQNKGILPYDLYWTNTLKILQDMNEVINLFGQNSFISLILQIFWYKWKNYKS